ncbi:MAG: YHS domain-containing (seleno)protein [Bacteroidota bacterium]
MKNLVVALILIAATFNTFAQTEGLRKQHFNIKKNIAIEGYDPVSYFDGKPLKGKIDIKFMHKGVTYLFASAANMNKFKSKPDQYEPAYGGWCAYAMGENGEKVKVDPETFKILDGKLYLFYNFWGTNTLEDWNEDEKKLKARGDENWKKIVQ